MLKLFAKPAMAPAVLTAMLVAGTSSAFAASAGITSHRFDESAAEAAWAEGAPSGPVRTRLPLAAPAIFAIGDQNAPGSSISGVPGRSVDAPEGGAELAAPEAYGLETAPYTTARVAVQKLGKVFKKPAVPVASYPFRATGKLFMRFGTQTFVCTASLIRKGVLVTAAHCVHNFGQGDDGFATSVTWYPAQFSKKKSGKPYGGFKAINVFVPTPYVDGTDTCTQAGVVCNNDIATVVLKKAKIVKKRKNGTKKKVMKFAGQILGTYKYGYNGYAHTTAASLGNTNVAQITQLGYPVAFHAGYQMIRTDAPGWYFEDGNLKNTQMGSPQTGGSSGGPWIANFGTKAKAKASQATLGSDAQPNVVIGVTSYGAVALGFNRQGASFFGQNFEYPNADYGGFGAGNIGALVEATCLQHPTFC